MTVTYRRTQEPKSRYYAPSLLFNYYCSYEIHMKIAVISIEQGCIHDSISRVRVGRGSMVVGHGQ